MGTTRLLGVRIDLHTHSDRSDGTTSPADLVHHAHEVGIDVLALTDHDTVEGWDAAQRAAEETGLTLIRGLEISCKLGGHGVHLLAYLADPAYPLLAAELERILEGRNSRLPATLRNLQALGIEIDADDVRKVSGEAAALGRPHVADALVAKGVVKSRSEAFDKYLGPQGPAYVNRYAADLVDMIRTVTAAGGVTVVAHPWASRHNHEALDKLGIANLKSAGLAGIEVDHQDHAPAIREELRGIARNLDLVVTGSSDFHGAGKVNHELGCNTTAPEELERLLALADGSATASGRSTPGRR